MVQPESNIRLFQGTAPDIQEFFEEYGLEALEAYTSTRLFHATHSAFLGEIAAKGLRDDAEIINTADLDFMADIFERGGWAEDLGDKERFEHYITGKGYGPEQDSRGLFILSVLEGRGINPEALLDTSSYGTPERAVFFVQNLNQITKRETVAKATRQTAADLRDFYVDGLTHESPAIILLEVDPLAPEIINNRLHYIDTYRSLNPQDRLEALKFANSDEVNIPGSIPSEHLAVADAKQVDVARLKERLLQSEPGINFFRSQ